MKKLIKISLILGLALGLLSVGFIVGHRGMLENQLKSVQKMRQWSWEKKRAGEAATPPVFELIISKKNTALLDSCVAEAMADKSSVIGISILRDELKVKVPAKVVFKGDTIKAKIRIKGDYSDHWAGDKRSYRVKLQNGKLINGMNSFSVQDPFTRNYFTEWYFHKLLNHEGLIALNYEFVSVVENGHNKGVYAMEQSFDSSLLAGHGKQNGPILKFDETPWINKQVINSSNTYAQHDLFLAAKIDMFGAKKVLKDSVQNRLFEQGRLMLDKLRAKELTADQVFDIDKAARLFAVADLCQAYHGVRWKNVRFYMNPETEKMEIIGFDAFSGDIIWFYYYNKWCGRLGTKDLLEWKDHFFTNKPFLDAYLAHVQRISEPAYLDAFNDKYKAEMDLQLSYLYKEDPSYHFRAENYLWNAEIMQSQVDLNRNDTTAEAAPYLVEARLAGDLPPAPTVANITFYNRSIKSLLVFGLCDASGNALGPDFQTVVPPRTISRMAKGRTIELSFQEVPPLKFLKTRRLDNRIVLKGIFVKVAFAGQEPIVVPVEQASVLTN